MGPDQKQTLLARGSAEYEAGSLLAERRQVRAAALAQPLLWHSLERALSCIYVQTLCSRLRNWHLFNGLHQMRKQMATREDQNVNEEPHPLKCRGRGALRRTSTLVHVK